MDEIVVQAMTGGIEDGADQRSWVGNGLPAVVILQLDAEGRNAGAPW